MKVDYYFPPGPPTEAPALARRAAALGFDGFFTAELSHDPFFPLLLAGATEPGLELGTAIAVAFPRSPMVTAQICWDLAAATRGRFRLGLGTQVKAHITRRFSTTWDSPGPRLREYILALRAIWNTWQNSVPLRFEGRYYQFSLMTPFFDPGPITHPDVPIYIAGVGPYMSKMAGELCQGFHVHPFHTIRYLDEVVLPSMTAGAAAVGRTLDDVDRAASVFIITGHNDQELDMARQGVRQQIAFYASTPTYRPVLELHGWEMGDRLTAMSKRGEWSQMAGLVTDDMIEAVAVTAPLSNLGAAIRARYGDRVQRVGYYTMLGGGLSEADWTSLIAATKG